MLWFSVCIYICVLLNKYKYININVNVNIIILYVSILPMYLYNFIHLNIIQRAITARVPLMLCLWFSLGPSGVGILWHFLLREHLQAEAIDNGASWSSEEPRLSVHLSKKDWFKGHVTGKPWKTPNISWEHRWFPVKIFPRKPLHSISDRLLQTCHGRICCWQLTISRHRHRGGTTNNI